MSGFMRTHKVNENDAQLMASSGQDGLRTDSFGARRVQLAIQLFGPTLEHRPGRRFQPRRSPLNIYVILADAPHVYENFTGHLLPRSSVALGFGWCGG